LFKKSKLFLKDSKIFFGIYSNSHKNFKFCYFAHKKILQLTKMLFLTVRNMTQHDKRNTQYLIE